jgi:hypothetical protein
MRITSIHAKRVWGCQNVVIRRNVIGRKGRKKTYNDLQNTTWSGVIICHKLKDRQNNVRTFVFILVDKNIGQLYLLVYTFTF